METDAQSTSVPPPVTQNEQRRAFRSELSGRAIVYVVTVKHDFGMRKGLPSLHATQVLYIIDVATAGRSSFLYLKIIHSIFSNFFQTHTF